MYSGFVCAIMCVCCTVECVCTCSCVCLCVFIVYCKPLGGGPIVSAHRWFNPGRQDTDAVFVQGPNGLCETLSLTRQSGRSHTQHK